LFLGGRSQIVFLIAHPSVFARQVKGDNYRASFHETGDTESSVWSCGPVMGLIDDVPTCEVLIKRMVEEAEQIIRGRLAGMVK
jgi:nitronate monooxygenase